MPHWWEKETIRFECQKGCIQCCTRPGWVYFDKEDVQNAAAFLGLPPSTFKTRYRLRPFGPGNWEMEVGEQQPCPFLNEQGCSIHPVKPKQCRTFPFWGENLRTRRDWNKTGEHCPGIGEGPAWSSRLIRDNIKSAGP